ncbi:MAG TPA: peptide chain release factor N(5)-glutamine methyltransferase [Anaerolineales bacterium]|nr:peptide chain release factor N(5)-glutamine methyltransferase [Anaerolineales bacterium]
MTTSFLTDITNRLTPVSDTPALDASVLIGHILNKPRTWVRAHPALTLTTEQQIQLDDSLARLERGESFPYVLGHWEFFGLEFDITPDVLIPRPETELLVERAITWLQEFPGRRRIADVGTGSGAIGVSIAASVRDVKVLATDISPKALQVARLNAEKHRVNKSMEFVECDLLPIRSPAGNQESEIDLLCANLPYIPTETLHSLSIFEHEPTLALDGGPDGLDLHRRLFSLVPEWLASDGKTLLEIETTQGTKILAMANDLFPGAEISLHRDLSGHDRLLEISLSGK